MVVRKLIDGVYNIGAIDWDRRLFDELIPTPDGTSYNAYLVQGSEKTALIDSVDPGKKDILFSNLEKLGVKRLDYLVSNHTEQDHSGTLPLLLERYPEAKIVTNKKCKDMLISHLLLPDERFLVVGDWEELSLGDRTLQFIITPWVHWPETMLTFLKEDGFLFPCDFLGSHLATSSSFVYNEAKVYEAAKRYFGEIMMPFRAQIKRHLEKIKDLDIKYIGPSHGPAHNRPGFIIDAYRDWSSDRVKPEVLIPYVSMHGSTRAMVDHLVSALIDRGVKVTPFNLPRTDLGELAIALVDASTIVIGAPALLIGPHPVAANAVYIVNALRPKTRFATIIGSFGWGCKTAEKIKEMTGNLKVELLEPVIVKGYPTEADFLALDRLADEILKKHESLA